MGREVWSELQMFVQWADMTPEMIKAVLTFLVVRGLGKAKLLVSQLPPHVQTPEKAILHIMEEARHILPSLGHLSPEEYRWVTEMFEIHAQDFNLNQFMQGENLPYNVNRLQSTIDDIDEARFRMYLFSVVGITSGLAGGTGRSDIHG